MLLVFHAHSDHLALRILPLFLFKEDGERIEEKEARPWQHRFGSRNTEKNE